MDEIYTELYLQAIQKTLNELAFRIHEAYYDKKVWDNGLFLDTLMDHFSKLIKLNHINEGRLLVNDIKLTTSLNDVFEYNVFTWLKKVNGRTIYDYNGKKVKF
jgi:hypothetical protein